MLCFIQIRFDRWFIDRWIMLLVNGHSMAPTINHDDLIITRPFLRNFDWKTPARSFFGNYEDEIKEETPNSSQRLEVSQSLKIPHRVPISERQLPAWAIDSVTCSQMVHPIMLPSGYWVDKSTFKKWKKESLLWSRPATDPFTGVQLPFELPVDEARRQQIFDLVHSPAFIDWWSFFE